MFSFKNKLKDNNFQKRLRTSGKGVVNKFELRRKWKSEACNFVSAIHKIRPQNLAVLDSPSSMSAYFKLLQAKINSSVCIWQTHPLDVDVHYG